MRDMQVRSLNNIQAEHSKIRGRTNSKDCRSNSIQNKKKAFESLIENLENFDIHEQMH